MSAILRRDKVIQYKAENASACILALDLTVRTLRIKSAFFPSSLLEELFSLVLCVSDLKFYFSTSPYYLTVNSQKCCMSANKFLSLNNDTALVFIFFKLFHPYWLQRIHFR